MMTHTHSAKQYRRTHGFSLMEVMISMGIFAVGLVSVAAIFPTAITIQRDTVENVTSQHIVQNAEQMMRSLARSKSSTSSVFSYDHAAPVGSRGTLEGYVNSGAGTADTQAQLMVVLPAPCNVTWEDLPASSTSSTLTSLEAEQVGFNLATGADAMPASEARTVSGSVNPYQRVLRTTRRIYPSTEPVWNISGSWTRDYNHALQQADYIWFPFVRGVGLSGGSPTWHTYIMVAKNTALDDTSMPTVMEVAVSNIPPAGAAGAGIGAIYFTNPTTPLTDNDFDTDGLPDLILPGDDVLDDNGRVHRVVTATRNYITVESQVVGKPTKLYFVGRVNPDHASLSDEEKLFREQRSPVIRIEQMILPVVSP
ncbi:type IV pilus modification PilV family protein [Poriferisphaera sp. WC338]|uniref:type IV pilus modification PilV family protein n=1 Tax=Poriferisphaera sp. WC338 TaxID=3425129 RepID=UPI003D818397